MARKPTTCDLTLSTPIGEGDAAITRLTLRRPLAGELRGIQLSMVQMQDVATMIRLIPRIAQPYVTEDQVATMEADDFGALSLAVVGFFFSADQAAELAAGLGS